MSLKNVAQPFKPTMSNLGDFEGENVFDVIAQVAKLLRTAGQDNAAKEFRQRAMRASSYGGVFQIAREYVSEE